MTRRLGQSIAATALAAAAVLLLLPAAAPAKKSAKKPAAFPQIAKCGKFKSKNKPRFRACKNQNKANRIAFNQIKNSAFDGFRGDGEEADLVFCANGKFETRLTDSSGTGTVSDKRWWVTNARVRNRGRWINAFVGAPGGFEIGLQRRGKQWKFGIASFDKIVEAGGVDRTNAVRECRTLEV